MPLPAKVRCDEWHGMGNDCEMAPSSAEVLNRLQDVRVNCHAGWSLRVLAALWGLAEGSEGFRAGGQGSEACSMKMYVAGLHGQDHPYTRGKHAL